MKKLLVSMFALFLLSFTAVQAQKVTKVETAPVTQEVQDEKVEIKAEELPEAVLNILATDDYTGWTVETIYHIKNKEQYEVKLKNGAESKKVKFKKDGKKV